MKPPISLVLLFCAPAAWAQVQTVRIPVVVHVIYADSARDNGISAEVKDKGNSSMYLPESKIAAEVANLHQDFLRLNADTSVVHPDFKKSIGNPGVDFFLSEIKYVKARRKQIAALWDNKARLCELSPVIDSKKYLNVYVSRIRHQGGGTNGVATVKNSREAGGARDVVFLNYEWVGLGYRLLTHETGHWLGLHHPWNLEAADGVDDVPSQTGGTDTDCEQCPPAVPEKLRAGQRFRHANYHNFMDYSGCRAMFSAQQATRVQKVIADYRPELLK